MALLNSPRPRRRLVGAVVVSVVVATGCGTDDASNDDAEISGFCVVSPKSTSLRGEEIGAHVAALDESDCLKEEPYVCGRIVDGEFQRLDCGTDGGGG